jgi:hypothetical protein
MDVLDTDEHYLNTLLSDSIFQIGKSGKFAPVIFQSKQQCAASLYIQLQQMYFIDIEEILLFNSWSVPLK